MFSIVMYSIIYTLVLVYQYSTEMGSCTSECDSEFMWCTEHFKIVQVQAQAPYFF